MKCLVNIIKKYVKFEIFVAQVCVLKIIILIKRIIEWSKTFTVINIEQGIPVKEMNIVGCK